MLDLGGQRVPIKTKKGKTKLELATIIALLFEEKESKKKVEEKNFSF